MMLRYTLVKLGQILSRKNDPGVSKKGALLIFWTSVYRTLMIFWELFINNVLVSLGILWEDAPLQLAVNG